MQIDLKQLLVIPLILIFTCKSELKPQVTENFTKQKFNHADVLNCLINKCVQLDFANNTLTTILGRQIRGCEFPGNKALLNIFYLSYPSFSYPDKRALQSNLNCELTFYDFSFNSSISDSINITRLINIYTSSHFGASNRELTFLKCLPDHYIVHLDTIKRPGYLLCYEIAAPRRDSTFINELSSCIKEIMDLTDCEKIDSIMAKLKHEH